MTYGTAVISSSSESAPSCSKSRALAELALAFVLILSVIWSPRPWQRVLWIFAAGGVAAMMAGSWDGPRPLGLRRGNFWRSLWVAGAALVFAAATVTMASHWHSLRLPQPSLTGMDPTAFGQVLLFVKSYWAYALWTFVQQFLLQGFFLNRLLTILPAPKVAAFAGGALFAVAHLPNPILTVATFAWGFAACLVFLRYRNLYSLAIAHAILGITLAITIPGPVIRNMRVGLGYVTYGQRHAAAVSLQPHRPDRVH
jgi:hypothetical protein